MSLSGGSGWIILDFLYHPGQLRTYWSVNQANALASGSPLLLTDMYEHAYQMDYGAAAAKYVDAFFQNIQWDEVSRRLERTHKAAAVIPSGVSCWHGLFSPSPFFRYRSQPVP